MKRLACILLLLSMLTFSAQAEILPDLTLVTPTPSPMPTATEFACEAFIVSLPAGLKLLEPAALEGYAAAVQALYPAQAQIQLAASNPDSGAVLCFILMETAQTPMEAAQEAALAITGSAENAVEAIFGVNSGACFRHDGDILPYSFHFFSNGSALLLICSSGLEDASISSMLSSLDF